MKPHIKYCYMNLVVVLLQDDWKVEGKIHLKLLLERTKPS